MGGHINFILGGSGVAKGDIDECPPPVVGVTFFTTNWFGSVTTGYDTL